GKPYKAHQPLGFSSYYVFALRETSLHILNRRNGQEVWEVALPNGPSAGPAADDRQVAVTVAGGRVYFSAVPKPEHALLTTGPRPAPKKRAAAPPGGGKPPALPDAKPEYGGKDGGPGEERPAPKATWDLQSGLSLELTPLRAGATLFWATTNGTVLALPLGFDPAERYRRPIVDGDITVPPGQHGEEA